jgi:hypothetical protein
MRLLSRVLTLTGEERRLLVMAVAWLAMIRLALGRLPFTTLRRLAIGRPRNPAAPPRGGEFIERVVWAVAAASRRAPGWTTCLTQALTVQAMLARRGYPSRLHIGVTRSSQGELDGHAWVEYEGDILIGGSVPELARFVPLAAFDIETIGPLAPSSFEASPPCGGY